jgi:hypothetical protein
MFTAAATFVLLAIQAAGLPSGRPAEAREGQWLHRELLGDGTRQPTAIFLSWDYSSVIFTVTCDPKANEVVIRYYLDAEWEATSVPQIVLSSPEQSVSLKTTRQANALEGRTRMTPALRALLTGRADLEIDAPNEMDEPYYVGHAKPLRKVALACP